MSDEKQNAVAPERDGLPNKLLEHEKLSYVTRYEKYTKLS